MLLIKFQSLWTRLWMRYAGLGTCGRIATRLATWGAPPYYKRKHLARLNPQGYIAPSAVIHHADLTLKANVFIDDRVVIFQSNNGGTVEIGKGAHLYRDTVIQNGAGGSITIGNHTHIQLRCLFSAYMAPIQIGSCVQIAANCAFYSYNHTFKPDNLIIKQPIQTKGGIVIDDDAWLGVGVIVLDGVRIGRGAVVGAGSVVTHDIPDGAIAAGVPARVVKMRDQVAYNEKTDEYAEIASR